MKKFLSILLVLCMVVVSFTACGNKKASDTKAPTPAPTGSTVDSSKGDKNANAEIVDGKFVKTRKITVEVYDRANDGGTKPEDNFYTNYIKEGMLRDHNVEVTFVPVPRWTETDQINNLLAAGTAPDVCVTYSYPTILTYAGMGGVLDLNKLVTDNKDLLPNLYNFLGDTNINWDKDPATGSLWAIEAKMAVNNRINTFVREDWLKKLNLAAPTSAQEFEAMLKAFKDNASTLLGKDADKMVPFSISYDIGWRADLLLASNIPDNITDKDLYVYGFDDRHFTLPGIKEGVRTLNTWYNEGLVWKDFALYGAGDTTEDNMMKAGYVGSFTHNWDYPYRNGEDSIAANLKRNVGADAAYVAVDSFKNDAGAYRKFLSAPIDRKVFFPTTNKEPVASLMYLDWITDPANLKFLQFGEEGVTSQTQPDGSIKSIAVTGDKIMNSPNNIDYTITCNGIYFQDEKTQIASVAQNYAGVDPSYIQKAFDINRNGARYGFNANAGAIKAEEGQGPALQQKRDTLLDQAVVAPANKFDSVFDSGMKDYLASGGQAIIDERKAAWEKLYGTATAIPAK